MIPSFMRWADQNSTSAGLALKINETEKGQLLGVCPLDSTGHVGVSYLNPGVMDFLGTWDATANNPTLADGTGTAGQMYMVSVGGTDFTPTITFSAGDFVVYDGSKWRRVQGTFLSLTSTNTNLLTVGGTQPNPTVTNLIGALQPVILQAQNNFTSGNYFTTNNMSTLSSVSIIYVGQLPYNVGGSDLYFPSFLNGIYYNSLPIRMRVTIQGSGGANYAEFLLTGQNAVTSSGYQFYGLYDASKSTITSISTTGSTFLLVQFFPVINKKNTLRNVDLQLTTYGTAFYPSTYSVSVNDSLDLLLSTTYAGVHDTLISFHPTASPQKILSFGGGGYVNRYFAVKMTGTNWSAVDLSNISIGFATGQFFDNIENNITSNAWTYQPVWNVSVSQNNRAFTMNFSGTTGYINYNTSAIAATRAGYTSDSLITINDVIIVSTDYANSNCILYWYRGSTQLSNLYITIPSGAKLSNFWYGAIVPIVNSFYRGTGYDIRIMSQRDLTIDGITATLLPNECIFY